MLGYHEKVAIGGDLEKLKAGNSNKKDIGEKLWRLEEKLQMNHKGSKRAGRLEEKGFSFKGLRRMIKKESCLHSG
jgi:hypothetical protein